MKMPTLHCGGGTGQNATVRTTTEMTAYGRTIFSFRENLRSMAFPYSVYTVSSDLLPHRPLSIFPFVRDLQSTASKAPDLSFD